MPKEFKLPEVSEGVESADIAELLVSPGDVIAPGQTVMEVETEKAVTPLECPIGGKIAHVHVQEGDTVSIGTLLLTIEESSEAPSDESTEDAPDDAPSESDAETEQESPEPPETPPPSDPTPAFTRTSDDIAEASPAVSRLPQDDQNGRRRQPAPASPSTRRLARELNVDLYQVQGSGPGGRITTEDVKSHVRGLMTRESVSEITTPMAAPTLPDFTRFGPIDRQPLNKLARVSAQNLGVAWQVVPHVTQHDLADVTELEAARKRYVQKVGKDGPKVTMTAIIIKAVVGALKAFPHFNSSLDAGAGELIVKQYYHIGVAVDTEYGLVVPVIRDADAKTVLEIAGELTDLATRARDRKLQLDEMQGGTFTITNLGGIGGTSFTPIVNYPEVAILGLSRTQKHPRIVEGELSERLMLPLSLSYDHRVVNGADAARFIVKLSSILSDFFQMTVEC